MKTGKCMLNIFILMTILSITSYGFEKKSTQTSQYATIIGLLPESAGIDSVRLYLYDENTASELSLNITGLISVSSKVKNGKYSFNIPVDDKVLYFSLYKNQGAWPEGKHRLLNFHLVEKGDYVVINHLGQKITFSGEGSAKHNLHMLFSNKEGYIYEFDDSKKHARMVKTRGHSAQNKFRYDDTFSTIKRLLNLLEKNKSKLSKPAYQLLYCEIIGNSQYPLMRITRNLTGRMFMIEQSHKDAMILQFKSIQKKLVTSKFPDSITASSIRYIKYYFERLKLLRAVNKDSSDLISYIIKSTNKGELRDKLLISAIGLSYKHFEKSTQLALDNMHSPILKNKLQVFYDNQKNGAMLPDDFILYDQNSDKVNLSAYKGKVIFLDFWFIGCIPCANYHKNTVSTAMKSFLNNEMVVFVTVCTEKDYKKWITALEADVYTSKSAVNLFTGGTEYNHPLITYFNIVSAPTPILIDKNFKVFSRDGMVLGMGNNPSSLVAAIQLCIKN